jgi:hypothetical protein
MGIHKVSQDLKIFQESSGTFAATIEEAFG